METNNTTEPEYWIERIPVTHFMVSVISRGFSELTGRKGRFADTRAISMEMAGHAGTELKDGEKVIACIPAEHGSVERFVNWVDENGKWQRESIGFFIRGAGADNEDWDKLARETIGSY